MNNITFDKEAQENLEKESIEWLRIWCEDTNNEELPRIALIGDSITEGYYNFVKEALKDIACVDYLATSYSIASSAYREIVKSFINDSNYNIVHFNYGLHAYSVSDELYASCCKELLQFISSKAKTIVATTQKTPNVYSILSPFVNLTMLFVFLFFMLSTNSFYYSKFSTACSIIIF